MSHHLVEQLRGKSNVKAQLRSEVVAAAVGQGSMAIAFVHKDLEQEAR